MPLLLAPLLAFGLGAALSWAPSRPAERGEGLWPPSRETAVVALFAALVFAPVHAWFVWFAGDWSLAYLADSRLVPSAVELVLIALDTALVVVGFRVARHRVKTFASLVVVTAAPLGMAALGAALLASRLSVDASFHRFQNDYGLQSIAGSSLGLAILWLDGLLLVGAVLTARDLVHAPRPVQAEGDAPPGEEPKRRLGQRSA